MNMYNGNKKAATAAAAEIGDGPVITLHHGDDCSVASEITFQSTTVQQRSLSMEKLKKLMQREEVPQETMGTRQVSPSAPKGRSIISKNYYPNPKRASSPGYHQSHQARQEDEALSTRRPLYGKPFRRHTEPQTKGDDQPRSPSPSAYINEIIELKLQLANQKESIDRLTSERNNALSENKIPPIKTRRRRLSIMSSLVEEKAYSYEDSGSLHQKYNELQGAMNNLQKSFDLQKKTMDVMEEDNRRLIKERDTLQEQVDRLIASSCSCSSPSCSSPNIHLDCSDSHGVTASCTADLSFSSLIESDEISPSELLHSSYQPRRASYEEKAEQQESNVSYFPWNSMPKRRFSEPDNSGHSSKLPTRHDQVHPSEIQKEIKSGWFISDESERSYLSNFIFGRVSPTQAAAEEQNINVLQRRSSMPCTSSSKHPISNTLLINTSKRSCASRDTFTINESYMSFVQSENTNTSSSTGDHFTSVDWGD